MHKLLSIMFCVLVLTGCNAAMKMGKTVPAVPGMVESGNPGEVVTVSPGESVLESAKGARTPALIVHNDVRGEMSLATMDFPAASYGACTTCFEEDDKYAYYFHPARNGFLAGEGVTNSIWTRAGYRASKQHPSEVVPFMYYEFGDGVMEATPAPDFTYGFAVDAKLEHVYEDIRFVSFDDDILTLRTVKGQGPAKEGEDKKEEELTLQFDLLESRDIEVDGARFTVIEATPKRLVVKILNGIPL